MVQLVAFPLLLVCDSLCVWGWSRLYTFSLLCINAGLSRGDCWEWCIFAVHYYAIYMHIILKCKYALLYISAFFRLTLTLCVCEHDVSLMPFPHNVSLFVSWVYIELCMLSVTWPGKWNGFGLLTAHSQAVPHFSCCWNVWLLRLLYSHSVSGLSASTARQIAGIKNQNSSFFFFL